MQNNRIFLYGAGVAGRFLLHRLLFSGFIPECIWDKNAESLEESYYDVPISLPDYNKYTEKEKQNAFAILAKLGLTEQAYKRCDQLSGGQKQRVGIARSIMQEPRLILCDEPIASLDPSSSKVIMDHLSDINQTMKITCILNLHQVDVALKYSKRIIGLTGGNIVYDGPPEQLSKAKIHEIYQSNEGELITDVG